MYSEEMAAVKFAVFYEIINKTTYYAYCSINDANSSPESPWQDKLGNYVMDEEYEECEMATLESNEDILNTEFMDDSNPYDDMPDQFQTQTPAEPKAASNAPSNEVIAQFSKLIGCYMPEVEPEVTPTMEGPTYNYWIDWIPKRFDGVTYV